MVFSRVKLRFSGLEVEFVDRDLALRLVGDWARRGTGFPKVVYGPEGCGKTAWLRQSVELLKDYGFEVVYVNPINREFLAEVNITDLREDFLRLVKEAISQNALGRLAWLAFDFVKELIRATRGRIAVIVDDAFQVIGVKESALYVKALLNLIEYPPGHYEKIVAVAATSEGLSRREIGRHLWSDIMPMWNMSRKGFEELYEQIPGGKPNVDDVWRITGGNPRILERLYEDGWNVDKVIKSLIEEKGLRTFMASLSAGDRDLLMKALDDPDVLMSREGIPLLNRLIELNLALDIPERKDQDLWVDNPPPERDLELGIGRYVAWQTPLHREAVRRALEVLR